MIIFPLVGVTFDAINLSILFPTGSGFLARQVFYSSKLLLNDVVQIASHLGLLELDIMPVSG